MEGILIRPDQFSLELVELPHPDSREWLDRVYSLLKVDCFDLVTFHQTQDGKREVCLVDDEGFLNNSLSRIGGFILSDYPEPLAGRGLIIGTGPMGESVSTSLTIPQVENRITWGRRRKNKEGKDILAFPGHGYFTLPVLVTQGKPEVEK